MQHRIGQASQTTQAARLIQVAYHLPHAQRRQMRIPHAHQSQHLPALQQLWKYAAHHITAADDQ